MTGIARVGKDFAGGIILDSGNTSVLAEGSPVVVPGDAVAGHGMAPHSTAVMVRASTRVYAGRNRVCRAGDLASCGHKATGSSRVSAS